MAPRHRTPSRLIEGKILEAALGLLDEQGFRALTVRGIASRAGVAPMGIYNRFESKTGVYDALWIEGFERLAATLSGVALTSDAVEDLLESGRRYLDFALANPSYYRLMFMGSASGYAPSKEALRVAHGAFQVLLDAVRRVQICGYRTDVSDLDLAQTLWADVHGHATLRMLGLSFARDPDAAYEVMLASTRMYLTAP